MLGEGEEGIELIPLNVFLNDELPFKGIPFKGIGTWATHENLFGGKRGMK